MSTFGICFILELHKLYQRNYIVILTDLPNATNKMLDKISFHEHFKQIAIQSIQLALPTFRTTDSRFPVQSIAILKF